MPSAPPRAEGGAPAGPGTPTLLRRFGAWVVDWACCLLVVFVLLPYDLVLEPGSEPPLLLGVPESSWATLGVFALLNVLLVSTAGSTLGHRLFGMQVWQVRPGSFPLQVVVRTALLCLVLPALVTSRDGRGFHDVWAGTRIVLS